MNIVEKYKDKAAIEFFRDLQAAGARGLKEANEINHFVCENETHYQSLEELITDFRRYHKISFKRLSQIFHTADFYDDEIEISKEAVLTLQEWQDNPLPEFLNGLPQDAIDLLNNYYPDGWWNYRKQYRKGNSSMINMEKFKKANQLIKKLRRLEELERGNQSR